MSRHAHIISMETTKPSLTQWLAGLSNIRRDLCHLRSAHYRSTENGAPSWCYAHYFAAELSFPITQQTDTPTTSIVIEHGMQSSEYNTSCVFFPFMSSALVVERDSSRYRGRNNGTCITRYPIWDANCSAKLFRTLNSPQWKFTCGGTRPARRYERSPAHQDMRGLYHVRAQFCTVVCLTVTYPWSNELNHAQSFVVRHILLPSLTQILFILRCSSSKSSSNLNDFKFSVKKVFQAHNEENRGDSDFKVDVYRNLWKTNHRVLTVSTSFSSDLIRFQIQFYILSQHRIF